MRGHTRTWRRVAAAVAASALMAGSLPVAGFADEPPFQVDLEVLTERLLAAQVQIHHGGQAGIERLLLSAEFLEWRRQHPNANDSEATSQLEARKDALTDGLTAPDRMLTEAEFAVRSASVLVNGADPTAAAAPHVRRLVEVTLGKSVADFDVREDLVSGSLLDTHWLRARGEVETELWADVRRQALVDPAFASAWNTVLGYPAVDATASLAEIKADPKLSALIDVDAILLQSGSRPAFLAEVQRQFGLVAAVLASESAQARARLVALSTSCPVKTDVVCTPQQRAAAAATAKAEQKEIDAAGAAAKVLGGLARIGDKKTGEKIEKVAAAWYSIIGAINKYATAVAGRSAEDALFDGATLVLTGNVIGAVMTLVSLLGESTPSLDQQILDQIVQLRQEVRAMHQEMRASFERIESQLNTIYDAMMHQFDRLNATLAGNTAALTNVQNQLAAQSLRLETVAATILAAIGAAELEETRADVNQYIGYRDSFGVPIPSDIEYRGAESQFHLAATSLSSDPAFVVPMSLASDPTADPTDLLDSNGESASLSYLARLARFRDPRVPDLFQALANPSVWNFSAQAYALLALQNPDYAAGVVQARSAQVGFEGEQILDVAGSFSRPASPPSTDPTNPIFRSLVAEYRNALGRFRTRLATIRAQEVVMRKEPSGPNFIPVAKSYNLFGPGNQSIPAPPDPKLPNGLPAPLRPCAPGENGPSLARPVNVSFSLLAPEFRFAHYAFSPVMGDTPSLPELGHCYDAQFVNVRQVTGPLYDETYARLRLTMRTRFRWATLPAGQQSPLPDHQWRNARNATYTWPEVRIARTCISIHCSSSNNSYVTVQEEVARRYPSGKALFEQSATISSDGALTSSVRTRMEAFLNGRQRAFYELAFEDMHNASRELNVAGRDMSVAARQLQAYTRLGFPVALGNDDILSSVLFGRYPLLVNKAIAPQLAITLDTAANAYGCQPAVDVGESCYNPFGGAFQPLRSQPHLETRATGIVFTAPVVCAVSTAGVPGLPGDPVGDCVVASATRNLNRLEERYRHYSQLLASGTYQERLPWIVSTLETLPLVDTIVRAETSN